MGFQERLKELREEAGLSQRELADKLEVTKDRIFNWESGRGEPSYLTLPEISKSFNVSIDYLLGNVEERSKTLFAADWDRKYFSALFCRAIPLIQHSYDQSLTMCELFSALDIKEQEFVQYKNANAEKAPSIELLIKIDDLTHGEVSLDELVKIFPSYMSDFAYGAIQRARTISNTTVPLLCKIQPGKPVFDDENFTENLELSDEFNCDFGYRINDDTLHWAGIYENDIALINKGKEAENGDLVAVLKRGNDPRVILRYFTTGNNTPALRAANPKYPDIPFEGDWSVIGIATRIIHKSPDLHKYDNLLSFKTNRDAGWDSVIETAANYGLDPESLKGFISVMHTMIKAAKS